MNLNSRLLARMAPQEDGIVTEEVGALAEKELGASPAPGELRPGNPLEGQSDTPLACAELAYLEKSTSEVTEEQGDR